MKHFLLYCATVLSVIFTSCEPISRASQYDEQQAILQTLFNSNAIRNFEEIPDSTSNGVSEGYLKYWLDDAIKPMISAHPSLDESYEDFKDGILRSHEDYEPIPINVEMYDTHWFQDENDGPPLSLESPLFHKDLAIISYELWPEREEEQYRGFILFKKFCGKHWIVLDTYIYSIDIEPSPVILE